LRPIEAAWCVLKMPKEDFPYWGDPDEFRMEHEFRNTGDAVGQQIVVTALQGLEKYGEQQPFVYGQATLMIKDDHLRPFTVWVHPQYQRQNLATEMYDRAEEVTGLKVENLNEWQSRSAQAFWENREGGE